MLTRKFWLRGFPILILAACSVRSNGPARAIEDYFKALVAKDAVKAVSLSCADWESSAQIDSDTFIAYSATLESISCSELSRADDLAEVGCTGKTILDYNGEKQEINFADRNYQARLEGGEWRMCGYQ
jgi:1,6-anhydro-N-acetylmuramate kinase